MNREFIVYEVNSNEALSYTLGKGVISLAAGFIFRIWDLEDAEISENTRTWHLSVTFYCVFGIPPLLLYRAQPYKPTKQDWER